MAQGAARPLGDGPAMPGSVELKRSFRKGAANLEKAFRSADALYALPWFLMLGEPGAGKGALLGESGMAPQPGFPETNGIEPEVANYWWAYNNAVVIDCFEGVFAVTDEPKAAGKQKKPGFFKRLFRRNKAAASRGAWSDLLDALQDVRRLRPLDGVILTVDVGSLLMQTPEAAGAISRRAEAVAARLHKAQAQLAVDFPVYIVLTGCEKLRGFATFTRTLPEQVRDQIFGWSSPYEPDTGFQADWIDEAISSLHEQACVAQVELLAQISSQRERDDLYLLPREVRSLAEPLRLYLDPLFKISSVRRGLPLRGIYLTARVSDKAPEEKPAGPPGMPPLPPGIAPLPGADDGAPKGKPRFVRQLFAEKIFQEPGLARIDEKRNKALNKKVRNARIGLFVTLLVSGLLILLQRGLVSGELENFQPMMSVFNETIQSEGRGPKTSANEVRARGVQALEAMATLQFDGFESLLAPTTYFEGLTGEVNTAIAAVGASVGEPMRETLKQRADALLPNEYDHTCLLQKPSDLIGLPDPRPEKHFAELRTFVDEVTQLRLAFEQFNEADLVNIAKVYLYLTGNDITEKLASNTGLYQDALEAMKAQWPRMSYEAVNDVDRYAQAPRCPGTEQEIKRASYAVRAKNKLEQLVDVMHLEIFGEHPLAKELESVRGYLDTIEALDPAAQATRLRDIIDSIELVESLIQDGKAEWILKSEFKPADDYQDVINQLDDAAFALPENGRLSGLVLDRNRRAFNTLRSSIRDQASLNLRGRGDTEPVRLLSTVDERVALNPRLTALKVALDRYFDQPYVIRDKSQFDLDLARDAGTRAQWSDKLINMLKSWERNYQAFIGADRANVSVALDKAIGAAARTEFRNEMRRVMLDYASPQRLDDVDEGSTTGGWTAQQRQELKDRISNVADLFDRILEIVKVVDDVTKDLNEAVDSRLFAILRDDILDLLKKVDSILKEEKPYAIRENFSLADSRQTPGVVAFGARDANDLIARLGVKRKTVQELAYEYARPLVDVMVKLGQPYASDVLVEKWGKIIGVLTDFEKKVPGNSLEDLERFIEEELNRVQLSSCADQLNPHVNRYERDDFFKDAKYLIGSTMIRRCTEDLRKFTLRGYVEIQTFFEERLAGRFPFAGPDVIAEVETKDIVEFYRQFNTYAGAFKVFSRPGTSGGPLFGEATADVLRFIQQVERMRPLFAPLIASEDENPDLLLDIDFEFRVNRDNEVNGNQIIDWYSIVAESQVGHRDNKRGAQWRTNDPISVCFRWAKNAIFLPAVNQRNEAARINGRVACYAYAGRFGLIRLLVANAATPADRGRRAFLRPHTLRFETETSLASAAQDNASLLVTDTRVYVRVGLILPGGKSAFRLPDFPRRAPEINNEFLKAEGVRADAGSSAEL